MRMDRGLKLSGAALLAIGAAVMAAPTVSAAFPGANGNIAFVTTRAGGGAPAVFQVDPTAPGVGTPSGNAAATTQLTGAANVDAPPFFSPTGSTVVFSSNRSGHFAIYSLAANSIPDTTNQTDGATLVSQTSTDVNDDFAPSISPDGHTLVFNRDNAGLWTADLNAANPGATATQLLSVALAPAGDNGAGSRPVFNPVNSTQLLYVGSDNHIHLLGGVGSGSLTNTDLSAATGIGATALDANPDWSPDGTKVVFDSSRLGGRKLFTLNPAATVSSPVAAVALWPSWTRNNTQPVFSPDGQYIAYTEAILGSSVLAKNVVPVNGSASSAVNVSSVPVGTPQNSQPSWAPKAPSPVVPEAPLAILLPGVALVICGTVVSVRRRRTA